MENISRDSIISSMSSIYPYEFPKLSYGSILIISEAMIKIPYVKTGNALGLA